jgi:hypothetical protein
MTVLGQKYDLFVGHPSGWINVVNQNKIGTTVLFMPTTHPARRNQIMRRAAKKRNLEVEETLDYRQTQSALVRANYVIQIGNKFAVDALIENGIAVHKIIHMHYGINHLTPEDSGVERNLDNFLHLASGLGIRKGFPETLEIYEKYLTNKNLTIIGEVYKKI